MAYRPPQKRVQVKPVKQAKDEFPELAPAPVPKETKLNFASLFKNSKKKKKVVKMKWGTIRLTRTGIIDSLTPEERLEEEEWKDFVFQENHLWKTCCRLDKQQNIRREYDPHYESPDELEVSDSESEVEEVEEEEILTEDYEDEFEPEI